MSILYKDFLFMLQLRPFLSGFSRCFLLLPTNRNGRVSR